MTAQYDAGMIKELETFFLGRNDLVNRWGNVISSYLALPGLVGFWPMSSVQRSTGNAYDLSGQGRTLTYNGNPTYNIYNNIVPYLDFDGTGDYLSRADETDLDILGTEATNAAAVRGLTLGGWFWLGSGPGSNAEVFAKNQPGAGSNISYGLWIYSGASTTWRMYVSTDGSAWKEATSVGATSVWQFVVGRFIPSTSVDIYVNGVKSSNTTSIPASIYNSTASLDIYKTIVGRASLCFLCANALPDVLITGLFEQTRKLFGV